MCGTAIVKNARDCPASRLETKAIPGVFVFSPEISSKQAQSQEPAHGVR